MLDAQTIQMVLFLALIGGTTAYFAYLKGRNAYAWFALGFLFGLLALIALFFLPSLKSDFEKTGPVLLPIEATPTEGPLEWYYLDDANQQHGPVALETIRELYGKGSLTQATYLWKEGMGDWARIADLHEVTLHSPSRTQGSEKK